jgi:feruloyl esterase
MAACDADDGLVDGIVTNPFTCKFNPDTLLCAGAETDSCLTAPQLAALKKIYAGPSNPRTGRRIFPGFAVGSERQWTGLVTNLRATGLGTGYFANLTFENPSWDYSTFNFDLDMAYADLRVGILGNAIDPDLREARKRGVKIIQYHGWEDQTLQPAYSPEWYAEVVRANGGLKKTQVFYRLFMIPGMRHCSGGPGAWVVGQGTGQQPLVRDDLHDLQTAIESWVEHGKAPGKFIATKFTTDDVNATTVQFTRPLCAYPKIARYKGGDPNSASSFACVKPGRHRGDDRRGDDGD